MIKFFRHIRQRLLVDNRFSKYLLYAAGEIVLVVIGILLALQINNWNSDRMDQNRIINYYQRIHAEIGLEIRSLERNLSSNDRLIKMNRRCLEILKSQDLDSISSLRENIGAVGTAWTYELNCPITEEFLEQGYLSKIRNDSAKMAFKAFTDMKSVFAKNNSYTDTQYHSSIEPFINKHVNYSVVALEHYKVQLIQGGPGTDYEALFNNLEFWNIVTFKLEQLNSVSEDLRDCILLLEHVDRLLLKELDMSEGR